MVKKLSAPHAALLLIDVQEKFMPTLFEKERLLKNCALLIEGAKILGLPIFVTEQYPEKLGATVPELSQRIPHFSPFSKLAFSACVPDLRKALDGKKIKQLLICGIESHVCVMQTVQDGISMGLEVFVVKDAVTSRTESNWLAGIARMERAGGESVTTEMALFEMLKEAGTETFKQIGKLVR